MLRTVLNFLAEATLLLIAGVFIAYVLYGFMIPERYEKDLVPKIPWRDSID